MTEGPTPQPTPPPAVPEEPATPAVPGEPATPSTPPPTPPPTPPAPPPGPPGPPGHPPGPPNPPSPSDEVEDPARWGRIDETGKVTVRDPDGSERVIGEWHAGSVEEGLSFYARKYADLAAEVRLLESRVTLPGSDIKVIGGTARKLAESLPQAAVIGDLSALAARLGAVLTAVDARRARLAEERVAAAEQAAARKQVLVDEARKLAGSTSWRAGNDRFRAIVEEWKSIRGVDRATDSRLWEEFAAARREFDRNRRTAAAAAESERSAAATRKEELIRQAEKLSGSTDWAPTARRFRDLMTDWKAAGRAGRQADDELWQRFRAAQDKFFTARSAAFGAREAEQRTNLESKQGLLAEAEGIDVGSNPDAARRQLRRLQERWEAVGRVPRESMAELDRRFNAVEDRFRSVADARRPAARTESPLVIRLRESVEKLEGRLLRAKASGDDQLAAETETSLETQRAWLAQAEATTS